MEYKLNNLERNGYFLGVKNKEVVKCNNEIAYRNLERKNNPKPKDKNNLIN